MMCLAPLQILYSLATQRFSRGTLFNMVIATFMTWFVAFALLYPHHRDHPLPWLCTGHSEDPALWPCWSCRHGEVPAAPLCCPS